MASLTMPLWMHGLEGPDDWLVGARATSESDPRVAIAVALDATIVRALLVPSTMRLLGDANWWMPAWTRRVLRVRDPRPAAPEVAIESV